ncbi:MAG TPA: MBOAT family O-acyltransferase [Lentimicrobium sp.]|nr:MBOAT family O-acyltransferase [Lentimicrobium sp.]
MLFSSPIFLFLFLPVTLLGYYFANERYRNYWLLFASFIFFAWGGVSFTFILILSIILNYIFGIKIQKNLQYQTKAYRWLFIGVAVNVLILGIFKYANFIIKSINDLNELISVPLIPQTKILLPIGISFYTFHSLSYLVDIYRGKTKAQPNILDLSLYIAMFSQLIAGPIIRYSDVWQQLRGRVHTAAKFSYGVERFLIGLGKKVLLANTFANIADKIFAMDTVSMGGLNAWLGILCYTFQIYLDFSGYSDMAIGLGRMFGFEFLENFNFPYIAKSVKEFWRRWHISLSTFFRDYVYIPLGGNKLGIGRTYLNLLIVFFLTGFWHGASWSFVVWGLYHGFFMILERLGLGKVLEKVPGFISNIYTLIAVIFGWVLFRADSLTYAVDYWKALFNFSLTDLQLHTFLGFLNTELYLVTIFSVLGSFGFFTYFGRLIEIRINSAGRLNGALSVSFHTISVIFYASVLFLCSMYLISGTYNPFIYYRF